MFHAIYESKSVLYITAKFNKKHRSIKLPFLCYDNIELQMYKKHNKSRLSSQSDHQITM